MYQGMILACLDCWTGRHQDPHPVAMDKQRYCMILLVHVTLGRAAMVFPETHGASKLIGFVPSVLVSNWL